MADPLTVAASPFAVLSRAADAITREGAREAARDELSDPVYQAAEPSLLDRLADRAYRWLIELFARAIDITPGGVTSLVGIVVLLALLVVLLRLGIGPVRRRNALVDRRRGSRARTAAEYRAEAEALAARGEWKEALRARFRATIRELEERGVLDPRAGRTAGEVAREGGAAVPAIAADLAAQAGLFDEVWYGDRPAGRDGYERMAAADLRVRGTRLVVSR